MTKKLTEENKTTLLKSVEKICNVVYQKILKNQEFNSIEILNEIFVISVDIRKKYPQLKTELIKLLNSQFNLLLILSKEKGLLIIIEKLQSCLIRLNKYGV